MTLFDSLVDIALEDDLQHGSDYADTFLSNLHNITTALQSKTISYSEALRSLELPLLQLKSLADARRNIEQNCGYGTATSDIYTDDPLQGIFIHWNKRYYWTNGDYIYMYTENGHNDLDNIVWERPLNVHIDADKGQNHV